MIGKKITHYSVTAKLGEGGMGEVYRATDTKLGRDVALKLLPEAFASDGERMARFQREAQVLASLNHPNIAAIYGLEESDGLRCLVLELVEGPTLAERIARGPIPADEALTIARQVAEALEAAHERGVIHRDLKPGNVKVTPAGTAKVLDFGLAKAFGPENAEEDLAKSPTMTAMATQAGVILGTAAYMSPEQAKGKPVDRRADIWSFGVVLFEMLSGKQMFRGETPSETLAAVMMKDIDWSLLPAETPPPLLRLLRRCLEKDPKRRLQAIGEARIAIEEAISGADTVTALPSAPTAAGALPLHSPRARLVAAALVLVAVALGGTLAWVFKPAPKSPPVVRVAESLPPGTVVSSPVLAIQNLVAISPDGTKTVLATSRGLQLRSFDSLEATILAGTEGATDPVFSPDGRWIAFEMSGQLKKVPVTGGSPTAFGSAGGITGGLSWGPDNSILIGGALAGIRRVDPEGGSPAVLLRPQPGSYYAQPRALPDGKTFLFVRGNIGGGNSQVGDVVLQTFGKDDGTVVLSGVSGGAYLSGGQLIFLRDSGLFAASFDAQARRIVGEPVALAQNARASTGFSITHFAVSRTGTLVYVETASSGSSSRLVNVESSGKVTSLPTDVHSFSDPRVSPDGRRVAVHVTTEDDDVWVANTERGTISRLSFDPGEDETPVWSPDGRWVAWAATRKGTTRGIFRRPADGSGSEELVWKTENHTHLRDWLADGKTMVIESHDPSAGMDIWRLELGEKVTATAFLRTPFNERDSRVSPDGRWIAYSSDESGRDEVYVQSFPAPGAKLQVSAGGGVQPVWSRDGRSLFYRGNGSVQEVSFQAGPQPAVGKPRALFADSFEHPQGPGHTGYDARPGGGLLMIQSAEPQNAAANGGGRMVFVFDLLKR